MAADSTPSESDDTQKAIMEATYRALCTHGYASLSISKIADEFEKSKSLLYYHYEDKDELLVAFLDHIIDRFSANVAIEECTDPHVQVRAFFDRFLPTTLDTDRREFQVALFELRAQAPHHAAYRERFTTTDRLVRESIVTCIEAGIEQGIFRAVDSEATAQLFVSVVNGAMLERVSTENDDSVDDLRLALDDFVDQYLSEGDSA